LRRNGARDCWTPVGNGLGPRSAPPQAREPAGADSSHAFTGVFRAANHRPLLTLLEEIRETTDVARIGTGGVTGRQAYAVLAAGAIAVQLGTALLVLRRRGPLPLTGRRCGMRATPTRSSLAPAADVLPAAGKLTGGTGHFRHFHAKAAVSNTDGVNWAWKGTYRFSPDD
jgi:hypothetical protein